MLSRRDFLKSAALAPMAGQRPNVLFLSVDDMNDWVGGLGGYPGVRTPNLDALGKRGVLFSNAHCASPLCNPSRTSLLTGMRPDTTGIYDNDQFWRPELPGVQTLPMYFKANGYHAAGAGKVFHHTAGMNPPDQWDEFKLQVFDDPWYRRDEWYPWNKKIPAPPGHPFNGLKNFQGEFDWGVLDKPDSEFGDAAAVRFGADFLKRKHSKPFFLAVGLWHPERLGAFHLGQPRRLHLEVDVASTVGSDGFAKMFPRVDALPWRRSSTPSPSGFQPPRYFSWSSHSVG